MSIPGNEKWTNSNPDKPNDQSEKPTPGKGIDQKEGEDAPHVDIDREHHDRSHGRRHDGAIGTNKEPGTGI